MSRTRIVLTGLLVVLTALAGGRAFAAPSTEARSALSDRDGQGGGATSSLSGVVVDTSGGVLPGADVLVRSTATGQTYTTVTGAEGNFSVPALVNGTYSVTVSLQGFKTAALNAVTVNAATPASVKVTLQVGELAETVVVQGESSAIVQTQTAAIASTLDVNQISNLPLTSRSVLDFVINMAGVNTAAGSRNSIVNGLPQSTINITIDGMSVQDNHLKTGDGFFARVSPRLDAVDEVTVSTAAQGSEATGQGAVQIRFVTRSGTNTFTGSSYYYLQHYKLNANTWFNNRDRLSKPENILHQPGTRVGGPIVIPGLFDGRNRAFFFVNYEESRAPAELTRNRTILHPSAQAGTFRYVAGGQLREVNLLTLAAANGQVATIDPTIAAMLADIRAATGKTGSVLDLTDPNVQRYTYLVQRQGNTRYPTTRLDLNVTQKHRLSGSFNITDLLSSPDTLNSREPFFPGFPVQGVQDSFRYATQTTLRSAFTTSLVNEFRVGGTGGATKFAPGLSASMFGGTPVADQGGMFLNISPAASNITNASSGPANSAREASTKVIDNTLNWNAGTHSVQLGANFTQADVWLDNRQHVPQINFGIESGDPADGMFNAQNFPNASNTTLSEARDLYAVLTGRVSSIQANARLNDSAEYQYLGLSRQRAQLRDYGVFVADTWRWRQNLTINAGLRYEVQTPFYPLNDSYSTATVDDVWGVSGVGNLFKPGVMTGRKPQFIQYEKNKKAYNTDWNNFAPNLGFAWTPGAKPGVLGRLLGADGDSVLRAGYSIAYNRPGMSDFTGAIDDNPGIEIRADRTQSIGNLGTPGSILLRNRDQLGPPAIPGRPSYPLTDVVTEDVHIFDPNLQVPYAMTWTAGWQRKVARDMAFEIRYVGTRALQEWTTFNFNELNIVENGFLDEFRRAQANLQANIAAGRGANFRYFGSGTGTVPLPVFLAYFSGLPAVQAGDPARYGSSLFANSTFINPLARFNPQPFAAANALDADATRRANALRAGLPANFLVVNPDLLGGAEITGNGGFTRHNSVQLEFRKRLSRGLQFSSNYVLGKTYVWNRYSFRTPYARTRDTGGEGEVTQAFKANWVYDLPFGQGRRFGRNSGAWLDRLVGGWSFDGVTRIQTGQLVDFGNVRLVGMTEKEFSRAFGLRFDDANRAVYVLPQDIIDNTVKAFSVSATSPIGYGPSGPPTGRYLAPANGPDCIEIAQTNTISGFGQCGTRELIVTGPRQIRFDLSVVKRTRLAGRVLAEFRAEMLNAFNHPWFLPSTGASNNTYTNADTFRQTGLGGETTSRVIQVVSRVSW